MDVLLVLGDVTADHYQPIEAAMIRRGLQPIVRRVSSEYAFFPDNDWEAIDKMMPVALDLAPEDGSWLPWMERHVACIVHGVDHLRYPGMFLILESDTTPKEWLAFRKRYDLRYLRWIPNFDVDPHGRTSPAKHEIDSLIARGVTDHPRYVDI